MSESRKRHKKSDEIGNPEVDWPSWFIEPVHPLEKEILFRVIRSSKHLSDIWFTVHMMQINYIVFRKNYAELAKVQEEFNQPLIFNELALQSSKGFEIAQDTTIEFTRLLHNFLASAKMLVEVTRRWVRQQFSESEFLDTYQKEVTKRFENNVQARFLEDLRNFTLHRALPLTIPELRMHRLNERTLRSSLGIVLLKDHLLEWKKWSELGRMQIEMALEGEVDIVIICKQYFDNVTKFTQWLFWQVRELFSEEVDQINSVIEKLRNR